MYKTVLKVEGMHCGMCESFVNDVVRGCADVKKVTSSARKGETVILSEKPIDGEAVKSAISAKGYKVSSVEVEEYEKKGLFGRK